MKHCNSIILAEGLEVCPRGWTYVSIYDSCYIGLNISQGFKWDDARMTCKSEGNADSDLVILNENGEDTYIFDTYWKKWTLDSWIGAQYGKGLIFDSIDKHSLLQLGTVHLDP